MEMEAMVDEFMVVPTPVEELCRVDHFLLEENFEGLTGAIISSPSSSDQPTNFCTIDSLHDGQYDHNDSHHIQEFSDFSHHMYIRSNFSTLSSLVGEQIGNISRDVETAVYIGDSGEVNPGLGFSGATVDEIGGLEEFQFGEFEGHISNGSTENANLVDMERMAMENEQQCQILSDWLAQGGEDFEDIRNNYGAFEAVEMLEGLRGLLPDLAVIPEHSPTEQPAVAPKIPKRASSSTPHFHLADHDFGWSKRGRESRGTASKKKSGRIKFQAVLMKKKQLQNREAALRYRLKKRSEKMEKESELEQLRKRNEYLKNEKYALMAEVKSLKELLLEVQKLQGFK